MSVEFLIGSAIVAVVLALVAWRFSPWLRIKAGDGERLFR